MRRLLQSGHPRSGNTLLWKILSHIQQERGVFRSFSSDSGFQQIKEFYEKEKLIHQEDTQVDKFSIVDGTFSYVYPNEDIRFVRVDPALFISASSLLFTHDTADGCIDTPLFDRIDARFYVCRDPRPVYVSLCHHSVRETVRRLLPSYELDSIEEIMARDDLTARWAERWKHHARSFLEHQDAFELVRYESLIGNKRETIRRIAQKVDPQIGEHDIDRLVDSTMRVTSFQSMQEASPEHVRRGGLDTWKAELSSHAEQIIVEIAEPEMRALGYGLDEG